jgi:hypothetical protein
MRRWTQAATNIGGTGMRWSERRERAQANKTGAPPPPPPSATTWSATEQAFDLNIGEVLEHWTLAFAIRELIANALDEQALTATGDPLIVKEGSTWAIEDYGRGLRYEHLTQNESAEKRDHSAVIGQFGMGLKDALAVFDRRGVQVRVISRHADISTGRRAKDGFPDVVTLHALVALPTQPGRTGTRVELTGVSDADVAEARSLFLRFSGDTLLETTSYGQVLARPGNGPGRVFVKGLQVATEDNFLFSYNITGLSAALRKALNRERSNVGRGAYSPRVKDILTRCTSAAAAGPLAADLANFSAGGMHDELAWKDVAVHACKVLQTHEKVVFVTPDQLAEGSPQLRYAEADGYRLLVVPGDIAAALRRTTDLSGKPMVDLDRYRDEWNDSFSYTLIEPAVLTEAEQAVLALAQPAAASVGVRKLTSIGVRKVLISETMRLADSGQQVLGVWEAGDGAIIVRRDQLMSAEAFCGVLLHEVGHARSGQTDGCLEFEDELTRLLGAAAAAALRAR